MTSFRVENEKQALLPAVSKIPCSPFFLDKPVDAHMMPFVKALSGQSIKIYNILMALAYLTVPTLSVLDISAKLLHYLKNIPCTCMYKFRQTQLTRQLEPNAEVRQ